MCLFFYVDDLNDDVMGSLNDAIKTLKPCNLCKEQRYELVDSSLFDNKLFYENGEYGIESLNCTELFKNTGFDLAISKTASLPLGGSVSLTEGTYTHAYIIVDNNTHLKSVHEFSDVRKDMASTPGEGKFCYSNGTDRTENLKLELTNVVVTCGATDASAANKETIMFSTGANAYRNFDIINFNNEGDVIGDTDAGYTKLFALTAAGDAGTAWATDHSILAGQRITPVTISTTTKGLNIAFTVTDNVSFNFIAHGDKIPSAAGAACAAGSGKYCISDVGWMGMQFLVTSN